MNYAPPPSLGRLVYGPRFDAYHPRGSQPTVAPYIALAQTFPLMKSLTTLRAKYLVSSPAGPFAAIPALTAVPRPC